MKSIDHRNGYPSASGTHDRYFSLLVLLSLLVGLVIISFRSYPLFHSLAELFSIIIAFGIFVIAWNSRRFLDNNYLLLIGIAYLFVGGIDLIHTLTYKGVGIFTPYNANHPIQLWIAARSMESVSLLIAPYFIGRRLRAGTTFAAYAGVTLLLLWSIFFSQVFPDCYREGEGLTQFKIIAEYVICSILLLSGLYFFRKRSLFDRKVLHLLIFSIIATVVSEFAFTFYVDLYDLSNMVGHLFKIISFYFIYLAIIKTGLRDPMDVFFRSLRQSREELETAKDFLDTVMDNLTDSLIVVDPVTHAILGANKRFLNSCGLDKETVIGKRCYALIHQRSTPCSPPNDICPLGETVKTGKLVTAEHIHYDRTGRKLHVEVSTVPIISSEGEIRQVLHLSRDITERKDAEQMLRQHREELSQVSRLTTVGEFAASIAHEVNQPLAAILNNAQAAQRFLSSDTPAIDEVRETLQDIIDDDQRASEVIRHLRSFLKRKDNDRAILDINTVIDEVLTLLHGEIIDRQVQVIPDLSLVPRIEGDRIELQQVLMNLILNGCDAMIDVDPQRREMRIRTSGDDPSSIVVAVQDSGTGLDINTIDRMFEPFYTTKREGLGVGLSISKSIIAAHGGRIWAVNNPEGGATFSFTLPIYKGNAV